MREVQTLLVRSSPAVARSSASSATGPESRTAASRPSQRDDSRQMVNDYAGGPFGKHCCAVPFCWANVFTICPPGPGAELTRCETAARSPGVPKPWPGASADEPDPRQLALAGGPLAAIAGGTARARAPAAPSAAARLNERLRMMAPSIWLGLPIRGADPPTGSLGVSSLASPTSRRRLRWSPA